MELYIRRELNGVLIEDKCSLYRDEELELTKAWQGQQAIAGYGSYSKSFSVPADANNSEIFKYYNLIYGTLVNKEAPITKRNNLNPNYTLDARLVVNEFELIGNIQVVGFTTKNDSDNSFVLTFFADEKNVIKKINKQVNNRLNDINLDGLSFVFNKENVIDSWTANSAITYVPLMATERPFNYKLVNGIGNINASVATTGITMRDLKVSYNFKHLLDKIFGTYGITIEHSPQVTKLLNELYILINTRNSNASTDLTYIYTEAFGDTTIGALNVLCLTTGSTTTTGALLGNGDTSSWNNLSDYTQRSNNYYTASVKGDYSIKLSAKLITSPSGIPTVEQLNSYYSTNYEFVISYYAYIYDHDTGQVIYNTDNRIAKASLTMPSSFVEFRVPLEANQNISIGVNYEYEYTNYDTTPPNVSWNSMTFKDGEMSCIVKIEGLDTGGYDYKKTAPTFPDMLVTDFFINWCKTFNIFFIYDWHTEKINTYLKSELPSSFYDLTDYLLLDKTYNFTNEPRYKMIDYQFAEGKDLNNIYFERFGETLLKYGEFKRYYNYDVGIDKLEYKSVFTVFPKTILNLTDQDNLILDTTEIPLHSELNESLSPINVDFLLFYRNGIVQNVKPYLLQSAAGNVYETMNYATDYGPEGKDYTLDYNKLPNAVENNLVQRYLVTMDFLIPSHILYNIKVYDYLVVRGVYYEIIEINSNIETGLSKITMRTIDFSYGNTIEIPPPQTTTTTTTACPCTKPSITLFRDCGKVINVLVTYSGTCTEMTYYYSTDNMSTWTSGDTACQDAFDINTGICSGDTYVKVKLVCGGCTQWSNIKKITLIADVPEVTDVTFIGGTSVNVDVTYSGCCNKLTSYYIFDTGLTNWVTGDTSCQKSFDLDVGIPCGTVFVKVLLEASGCTTFSNTFKYTWTCPTTTTTTAGPTTTTTTQCPCITGSTTGTSYTYWIMYECWDYEHCDCEDPTNCAWIRYCDPVSGETFLDGLCRDCCEGSGATFTILSICPPTYYGLWPIECTTTSTSTSTTYGPTTTTTTVCPCDYNEIVVSTGTTYGIANTWGTYCSVTQEKYNAQTFTLDTPAIIKRVGILGWDRVGEPALTVRGILLTSKQYGGRAGCYQETETNYPGFDIAYSTNTLRFEGTPPSTPEWRYFCFNNVCLSAATSWSFGMYYTNQDVHDANNYVKLCTGPGTDYTGGTYAYKITPEVVNPYGYSMLDHDLSCRICYEVNLEACNYGPTTTTTTYGPTTTTTTYGPTTTTTTYGPTTTTTTQAIFRYCADQFNCGICTLTQGNCISIASLTELTVGKFYYCDSDGFVYKITNTESNSETPDDFTGPYDSCNYIDCPGTTTPMPTTTPAPEPTTTTTTYGPTTTTTQPGTTTTTTYGPTTTTTTYGPTTTTTTYGPTTTTTYVGEETTTTTTTYGPTTTTTTYGPTTTTTTYGPTTTTTTYGPTTTTTTYGPITTTTTLAATGDCYELLIPSESLTSGGQNLYIIYTPAGQAPTSADYTTFEDQGGYPSGVQIEICSESEPQYKYGSSGEEFASEWGTLNCSNCCSQTNQCAPLTTTSTTYGPTTTTTYGPTTTTTYGPTTTTTLVPTTTTTTSGCTRPDTYSPENWNNWSAYGSCTSQDLDIKNMATSGVSAAISDFCALIGDCTNHTVAGLQLWIEGSYPPEIGDRVFAYSFGCDLYPNDRTTLVYDMTDNTPCGYTGVIAIRIEDGYITQKSTFNT